ncbi:DUF1848 domain-containing protein [Aliarcobacter cryaerophilus]|nr:DUF1848 domain-containing protein [Aliarcobacter cryaerophilus]MCT7470083.1 DUF1848 domain-containing protein [Aliarcobacter cryaerophilus]MCT7494492.1 DUF1848 domain-containing protein [Aliarcobacter cryaerophilus]
MNSTNFSRFIISGMAKDIGQYNTCSDECSYF